MLTQVESIVCREGSLTLDQVNQHLLPKGDMLLQRITDFPTIKHIVDWLQAIPSFDPSILKQSRFDTMAVFVGDSHSHLITFWKGCHTLLLNFDQQYTMELLKLVGFGI